MFRFPFLLFVIYFIQINGCPPSTRIINGHDVGISEAPYMVQLWSGTIFGCGGSIITEKFIATAGHCILNIPLSIRAGSTLLEGGQEIAVKKTIRHPEYEEFSPYVINDFGLLLLEKSLVFGPNVQPIHLAKINVALNKMLFVTGWGKFSCDSGASETLQGAFVPMISEEECKTMFEIYHPSFICAGTFDEGVSAYKGDSGGALAVNNTLYGIPSFVEPEKVPNYPVSYSSVAYAYEWFMEEIEKMDLTN